MSDSLDIKTRNGTLSFTYWDRSKVIDVQIDDIEVSINRNDAWDLLEFLREVLEDEE